MTNQYHYTLNQLPVTERMVVKNWINSTLFSDEENTTYTIAYYDKAMLPHTWGAACCKVFWDRNRAMLSKYSVVIKAYLGI